MLAVEDYIYALEWAETLGGLSGLIARSEANAAALDRWVRATDWIDHLAVDPASRSTTSVCLKFADHAVEGLDDEAQLALVKKMASLLEGEKAAYDVAGYRDAPPGIRRSEEHTSELQSLMRSSYAVFCLKKKKTQTQIKT